MECAVSFGSNTLIYIKSSVAFHYVCILLFSAILALYLKNQLEFTDNTATVIYHIFIMICYFFPLLGAIVADSWLGKFKTILYLSLVYGLGNIVVSVAAIPNTLPPV